MRTAARRHWKRLAVGLAAWLSLGAGFALIAHLLGTSEMGVGFIVGVTIGATPVFWHGFLTGQGFAHRAIGADAEEWTSQALRALDGRQWRVFHDVLLEVANIDHVVVGAKRLYAIETKWVGGQLSDGYMKRLAGVASHRARALERALKEAGTARRVTPLLVVWGPGVQDAIPEEGRHVHPQGVTVVQGKYASRWTGRMQRAAAGLETDLPAIHTVAALAAAAEPGR